MIGSDLKKQYKNNILDCIGITNTPNTHTNTSVINNVNSNVSDTANTATNTSSDLFALVQYGLLMYLITKSTTELEKLAIGYIKNCTLLYDKVRNTQKKRKIANNNISVDVVVDYSLASTIVMSCCMVMLYPVDVPKYVPKLLSGLIKFLSISGGSGPASGGSTGSTPGTAGSTGITTNMNYTMLKDIIKKMVLEFKRSHQDRYKDDSFKALFTNEEWDDLTGSATSASYFS